MTERPSWLALLAPLPAEVKPERKAVASAEQIASGTAGPIVGWETVSVNLSDPLFGLRHLQITLDASGTLIAAGDHVMLIRETDPDGGEVTISDHVSVGGRFEADGSFRGTHWNTTLKGGEGDDGGDIKRSAAKRIPTASEIASLKHIVEDVLNRVREGETR